MSPVIRRVLNEGTSTPFLARTHLGSASGSCATTHYQLGGADVHEAKEALLDQDLGPSALR